MIDTLELSRLQCITENNCVSRGYLTDWYQQSVDETQKPIWTDAHLDELYNDFYLIPKIRQDKC